MIVGEKTEATVFSQEDNGPVKWLRYVDEVFIEVLSELDLEGVILCGVSL